MSTSVLLVSAISGLRLLENTLCGASATAHALPWPSGERSSSNGAFVPCPKAGRPLTAYLWVCFAMASEDIAGRGHRCVGVPAPQRWICDLRRFSGTRVLRAGRNCIGYVSLCAPALVRLLARRLRSFIRMRTSLPVSALAGACLVLGSDDALRALVSSDQAGAVPTGAVTLVGALFLIGLALRVRDSATARSQGAGDGRAVRLLCARRPCAAGADGAPRRRRTGVVRARWSRPSRATLSQNRASSESRAVRRSARYFL